MPNNKMLLLLLGILLIKEIVNITTEYCYYWLMNIMLIDTIFKLYIAIKLFR